MPSDNPFAFTGTCAKCGQLVSDGRAVHRECDVEVTEADREAARDLRASGFDGWMDGAQTESFLMVILARAIAKARIAENKACEEIASGKANSEEDGEGYYGAGASAADSIADAIAARRAAAQAKAPTEGGK